MVVSGNDLLVVGGGVAGLAAALAAVEAGARVTLLSLEEPRRSASVCRREGINAAFDAPGVEAHVRQTVAAGEGLLGPDEAESLCRAAPALVRLLARMGVPFDRTGEGALAAAPLGGAMEPRARRAGRATGQAILAALDGQLRRAVADGRAELVTGWELLSFLVAEGRCCGAVAQEIGSTKIAAFGAKAVVLATGGFEALFGAHTTAAVRDGAALMAAFEAGGELANPEFLSLAPLTITVGAKRVELPDEILALGAQLSVLREGSPAVLVEGGRLPSKREMLTMLREIAVETEQPIGALTLFLDATHLDPEEIERRAPAFADICAAHDIDPIAEPIPLRPAVDRTLGGLRVDARHATALPGLFAAGGCACRYRGAGELAGNGLLASLHGGLVAGRAAAAEERTPALSSALLEGAVRHEEERNEELLAREGEANAHALARELGELLFERAALERDDAALGEAQERIDAIAAAASRAKPADARPWANREVLFVRRLERRAVLAWIVVDAARRRAESRGMHLKPDAPERDDARWRKTTTVGAGTGGAASQVAHVDCAAGEER